MIDKKEQFLIATYHQRLMKKQIDEFDVFSLLILLRRHCDKHSPIFEIANFIAHRERDRGDIWKYMVRIKHELLKAQTGEGYNFQIKEVYTENNIIQALNELFRTLKLQEVTKDIGVMMVFCILSLLQHVELVDDKHYIGKLILGISEDSLKLMTLVPFQHPNGGEYFLSFEALKTSYPVRSLPNEIIKYFSDENSMEEGFIEVFNKGHSLCLNYHAGMK